jgi:hypothetical protein
MDKRHFDQLLKGVKQMKRYVEAKSVGKTMRGVIETKLPAPDIRVARPPKSARASSPN